MTYNPLYRRTGLIGIKQGMTSIFNELNQQIPVTLIKIDRNQVSGDKDGYLQLSSTDTDKLSKPLSKHFQSLNIHPKKHSKEFKVSNESKIQIGTELSAAHFVPGQFVDVQATSNGKGFSGVMKRHNFKGLRATHGTSISHRSQGSTGANQDPGRVFPGKKMAGRMGGETTTVQNLKIVRIDTQNNTILVKGSIPGRDNGTIYIKDAIKKLVIDGQNKFKKLGSQPEHTSKALPWGVDTLPFPAATQEMAASYPHILQAPAAPKKDD
ncbi:50S ribosomal protein L3 [Wallemia ichthyophaga EXF-994]|uniref:Large ribosomal subunit protein uL3m n=1 Tax=Wallemia ichthyophaga (strain EXF-994 / CBS 113033) TaxID=1299270 RepID=R9ASB5_WALI9|nr:50S ribosomal protein L3 [Wallemia ichthyophaga EXF-994]EOR02961.1 50S ribosomal protein L3 [Wallemia ichthyophaga EXF-994]